MWFHTEQKDMRGSYYLKIQQETINYLKIIATSLWRRAYLCWGGCFCAHAKVSTDKNVKVVKVGGWRLGTAVGERKQKLCVLIIESLLCDHARLSDVWPCGVFKATIRGAGSVMTPSGRRILLSAKNRFHLRAHLPLTPPSSPSHLTLIYLLHEVLLCPS